MADNKQSRVVFEELGKALDGYRGEWDGIEIANKNGLITFFVGGKEYRYEPVKESVPYGVDDGSGPDVRHLGDKSNGDAEVGTIINAYEEIYGFKSGRELVSTGDTGCRVRSTTSNYSGSGVGDIKVKINVDVSEAITGLKAVQREAKEATKALRGLEAQEYSRRHDIDFSSWDNVDLSGVTTKQLHEELAKREGVTEHIVKFPKGNAIIDITNEDSGEYIPMGGPARIIVIKE